MIIVCSSRVGISVRCHTVIAWQSPIALSVVYNQAKLVADALRGIPGKLVEQIVRSFIAFEGAWAIAKVDRRIAATRILRRIRSEEKEFVLNNVSAYGSADFIDVVCRIFHLGVIGDSRRQALQFPNAGSGSALKGEPLLYQ